MLKSDSIVRVFLVSIQRMPLAHVAGDRLLYFPNLVLSEAISTSFIEYR